MEIIWWIQCKSSRIKTFVVNRISEIHQKSNPSWCYVPSDLNCADGTTCGLHANELLTDHCWFSGPKFLYKREEDSPQKKRVKVEECFKEFLAEIAQSKMTFAKVIFQPWLDPLKYSSWNRLSRDTGC